MHARIRAARLSAILAYGQAFELCVRPRGRSRRTQPPTRSGEVGSSEYHDGSEPSPRGDGFVESSLLPSHFGETETRAGVARHIAYDSLIRVDSFVMTAEGGKQISFPHRGLYVQRIHLTCGSCHL